MKIAIVHDWLVTYRGGEKVLAAISELYPSAPIYTLFYDPSQVPDSIKQRDIRFSRKINAFKRVRKLLLPLLPSLIESIPLWDYDLVISTSSCVAKGVVIGPYTKHLCYLHSPMRYIWDQQEQYLDQFKSIPMACEFIKLASVGLRQWDVLSSQRVDKFLVNSNFVSQRVRRYYQRASTVLHPPIDVFKYSKNQGTSIHSQPYYLVAGAFVSYKRFELAIEACERMGRRLVVAGKGEQEGRLRKIAGRYTEFAIAPNDDHWAELLAGADALIFPGIEDFGMIAIEAMASGTPVLAFNRGGANDFINQGINGEFFCESSVEAVCNGIKAMESSNFDPVKIIDSAKKFERSIFQRRFKEEVDLLLTQ